MKLALGTVIGSLEHIDDVQWASDNEAASAGTDGIAEGEKATEPKVMGSVQQSAVGNDKRQVTEDRRLFDPAFSLGSTAKAEALLGQVDLSLSNSKPEKKADGEKGGVQVESAGAHSCV